MNGHESKHTPVFRLQSQVGLGGGGLSRVRVHRLSDEEDLGRLTCQGPSTCRIPEPHEIREGHYKKTEGEHGRPRSVTHPVGPSPTDGDGEPREPDEETLRTRQVGETEEKTRRTPVKWAPDALHDRCDGQESERRPEDV